MIKYLARLVSVVGIAGGMVGIGAADEAERTMNVTQGPESTFAQPLEEIFIELSSAVATGENGRVGNELVFWGHRLGDGREVFLVACAQRQGVDCADRETRVCDGPEEVLARTTMPGNVRHLNCRNVGFATPGDLRPGCSDRERTADLAVSLIQCG